MSETLEKVSIGNLRVINYGNQQHTYYCDNNGIIQHIFFSDGSYYYEQLNGTEGKTEASFAAGAPAVIGYGSQQHTYYRDNNGSIQHIFYSDGKYYCENLNGIEGKTEAPAATGDPAVIGYGSQQHTYYRDDNGSIQHIFYSDGKYYCENLNGIGGRTEAPAAAGDPAVIGYGSQQHTYYRDNSGAIQHIFYSDGKYYCENLNGIGGRTEAPAAAGDPAVIGYGSQQHTYYRDNNGSIQHIFYSDGKYYGENLNGRGVAVGDPAVIGYGNQQHTYYLDNNGIIQHLFYSDGTYYCQSLNGIGGETEAPAATGNPAVIGYGEKQNTYYCDKNNSIQNIFYNSNGYYYFEKISK